eukprot:gene3122-4024_t
MAAALPAQAQKIGQAPVGEPAVPQSHSVEQADARLAEVERSRAAVQAEYAAAEQVCNAKFFVNYCLDAVKEKRRVALAGLRAIEVEANQYKRKVAVDQPGLVRRFHGHRQLPHPAQQGGQVDRVFLVLRQLAPGLAGDQLHDDSPAFVILLDGIDLRERRVVQRRGHARFLDQAGRIALPVRK